jgi:hypothetical protein
VIILKSIGNRPKRTSEELIALINQRRADWWPAEFIVDAQAGGFNGNRATDFSNSLAQVVAELRLRHAWAGH